MAFFSLKTGPKRQFSYYFMKKAILAIFSLKTGLKWQVLYYFMKRENLFTAGAVLPHPPKIYYLSCDYDANALLPLCRTYRFSMKTVLYFF